MAAAQVCMEKCTVLINECRIEEVPHLHADTGSVFLGNGGDAIFWIDSDERMHPNNCPI